MSFAAIQWAFKQKPNRSTEKLVLLALANRVNKKHRDLAFPSVAQLCEDTQLNRKTIIVATASLVDQKIISDTGERRGHTSSVKVYKLSMEVIPKTGQLEAIDSDESELEEEELNSSQNGMAKQSQKRNSLEDEAVPFLPISSTVFTYKQSQKRTEAVPKTVLGTSKEPVKEPVRNLKEYTDHTGKTELDFSLWPSKPSKQIFLDWKAARKLKKQTLSQTVINNFGREISIAAEHGFSVDQCLEEVCARGWQGFKAEWLINKIQGVRNEKSGTGTAYETRFERSSRKAHELESRLLHEIADLENGSVGNSVMASND